MNSNKLIVRAAVLIALAGLAPVVLAQSAQRAAFVGNNGNIEGSVTSYTFSPAGVPQFVAKLVTGTGSGDAGNNVTGITLTPNGRYLATTHATAATVSERISILRVNADATLTHVGNFTTPDSPLDAVWISDTLLAVTRTNTSLADLVYVYRFDPLVPSLTQVDSKDAGTFTAYLEVTPDRQWVIAADSSGFTLRAFRVNGDGTLQDAVSTGTAPTYVLDPGFSRAHGRLRLYGGGGISNSSNKIPAYDFNPSDGTFTPLPNGPYVSPGGSPSPKLAVESSDGRFMIIGHGSSSEVRTFLIDPPTGDLTDTGFAFDVGIQGDLGDVEVLGDLLLVTDKFSTPNTGLYSFTINANGSLSMNGSLVSSQGTTPTGIAAWNPPAPSCYANCDTSTGNPLLTANDFQCFINKYAANDAYANCDGSTGTPALTANDFQCFINKYAGGC